MRRVTAWTLGALLVLVIFGAIRSMAPTEGMMGGLNVTSDDLVGYAESNAYGDSSDAKMYGDISWKIKTCSTITQADLNRAVNDAVTKAKSNCRHGYYE